MEKITADFGTLMRQAPSTIAVYFYDVVRTLDKEFGEGYAARNPALVGQMIIACAKDYDTSLRGLVAQELIESLDGLANSVEQGLGALAPQIIHGSGEDL